MSVLQGEGCQVGRAGQIGPLPAGAVVQRVGYKSVPLAETYPGHDASILGLYLVLDAVDIAGYQWPGKRPSVYYCARDVLVFDSNTRIDYCA